MTPSIQSGLAATPSPAECFHLMELHGMLPHIREHSMVVAAVGLLIARNLALQSMIVDTDLVVAGALLHDIGKTPSLHDDSNHARLGADICREHGLNTIAPIVEEHIVLQDFQPRRAVSETEIVFYADKRVNHDQVVDLDDRLAYILENYGNNDPERFALIRRNFQICRAVEEKIFTLLSFGPADVARLIPSALLPPAP